MRGGHAAGSHVVVSMGKTEIDQKQDEGVEPSIITSPEPFGSNSRALGLLTTDPAPVPLEMAHLNLHPIHLFT